MKKQGVLRASAFATLLTLLLLPGVVYANNVAVNCPGASLNAAVAALPPNGPNTITVTGTCNENGIVVTQGGHLLVSRFPHLIQGNGGGCPPHTPIPCGGIVGTANATLELRGGTISGNQGAGVSLEQGTNLRLNGATISYNSGGGIHLRWISIADFRDFGFGANTITGNGGASVFCDASRWSSATSRASPKSIAGRLRRIDLPNRVQHWDKDWIRMF